MPGDNGCIINIGNMQVDTSVTITFRATIDPGTPTDIVSKVINQGTVSGSNFSSRPTNDPRTLLANDATATVITRTDMVEPFKTWSLTTDVDGNGYPSPGDTIAYTTVIENHGNIDALDVVFTDIPDPNSTLLAGSVTTTLGTVTKGNSMGDNGVEVNIGTLPGAYASATVIFSVIVNNPLPSGVTSLTNQGFVYGSNFPADPTDDPTDRNYDNPTITPVTAAPLMASYKRYELIDDLNKDGLPGPGDNLTYIITVANKGNQSATGVQFSDHFSSQLTMVAGSARTSQGTLATDNATYMDVDIGTMPGGNYTVNISCVVTIKAGATGGIYNQGDIKGTNFAPIKTDDPNTHQISDATYTALALGPPELHATKSAILAVDADSDGKPSPGDTLQYIVAINNNGGSAADNITYTDTIDTKTTLVMGSTTINNPDAVITENLTGVSAYLGTLEEGTAHSIYLVTFRVTINNPLTQEVNTVSNQGTVKAAGNIEVKTDDPNTLDSFGDPTITTAYAHPLIYATKIDSLLIDINGNGIAEPEDTLEYIVNITNTGTTTATSVVFTDPIIDNLSLTGYLTVPPGSSIISGNHANDLSVKVNIPSIVKGASLSIIFRATINNPLPAGVNHVSNQGYISGANFSAISTDDPRTELIRDATSTPVIATPFVEPYKTWSLTIDADNNGYPSPGDTLTYSTIIENTGSQDATGVVFDDIPDANSTLIAGTVSTSRGIVTTDNNTGDSMVLVNVGTLPGRYSSATITFQVKIKSPLPPGVTLLSNQGFVYGTNFPSDPTDDPTDEYYDNPTVTPLIAVPFIRATKSCELSYDANKDGLAGPGDNLTYIIDIFNNGNQNASGLNFTDTPEPNTTLIAGSVTTSQGLVTTGNSAGPPADTRVAVNIGTLLGNGGYATVSFTTTVNASVVGLISNQGNISGSNFTSVPTDDPGTTKLNDATETPTAANLAASLHITKAAILATDNDHTGLPSPGDVVQYIITINNNGNEAAENITFTDTPDPNTTLIIGSVSSTQGIIVTGNNAGNTSVRVNIPVLPGGAAHSVCLVSFRVRINNPFPADTNRVSNLGSVTGNNFSPALTEDPGVSGAPGMPTITLIYAGPTPATPPQPVTPPAPPQPVTPSAPPQPVPQPSVTSHSSNMIGVGDRPYLPAPTNTPTNATISKPMDLPAFKVSNLVIQDTEVGKIIYVDVTNIGMATGTYTLNLKINGYTEHSTAISLNPSASERVQWLIDDNEPGIYNVEIDGLSATYYVDELKYLNQLIDPNIVLFISMALISASLLLAVVYIWKRRQGL